MELLSPLLIPTAIVISVSWYFFRAISNPQDSTPATPVFNTETIQINVFRGRQSQTIPVQNTQTPKSIAEGLFSASELLNKHVVMVSNGKRLNNEMSIGLQGVRNGDFFHIQLVESQVNSSRPEKKHNWVTLVTCSLGLGGFWWVYIQHPDYFTFISRLLLVGFTETVGFLVYREYRKWR